MSQYTAKATRAAPKRQDCTVGSSSASHREKAMPASTAAETRSASMPDYSTVPAI